MIGNILRTVRKHPDVSLKLLYDQIACGVNLRLNFFVVVDNVVLIGDACVCNYVSGSWLCYSCYPQSLHCVHGCLVSSCFFSIKFLIIWGEYYINFLMVSCVA